MRVGIVGCGLIGGRRAVAARAAGDTVVAAADRDPARAKALASGANATWTSSWEEVVVDDRVDVVVVATSNDGLLPIGCAALEAGKHVLCEKPLGRNAAEAAALVAAAKNAGRLLKTGFNHRHHPAIREAHELCAKGAIGELTSIRATYGHGGRPNYDQEWRADPVIAGGGELLDQGVHLVDLCRWFLGDFSEVAGMVATWFWNVLPLEDNGFALLRTPSGQIASIHSSWTQWKNLFRLEIFGVDGYVHVEGLGGSYGVERLTHGRRRAESGPPQETSWQFEGVDESWDREWQEFIQAIRERRRPLGDGSDGLAAALLIDAIYESARAGATVSLGRS